MIFFVFVTSFGFAMLAVGAAIADLWFRPAEIKTRSRSRSEPDPRSSGQVGRKASRKSPPA